MSMRIVYFPEDVATQSSTRQQMADDRGMTSLANLLPGSEHLRPHRARPTRERVYEPQNWEGQQCRAMIWLHYWKSEEGEAEQKASLTPVELGEVEGEGTFFNMTSSERFEYALRSSGAIGWTEERFDASIIRDEAAP